LLNIIQKWVNVGQMFSKMNKPDNQLGPGGALLPQVRHQALADWLLDEI